MKHQFQAILGIALHIPWVAFYLMYSYYDQGLKKTTQGTEINFDALKSLIESNPQAAAIAKLRSMEYGSEKYKRFKSTYPFPALKPHGTFKNINHKEILQQLSGYLYFDIDASAFTAPVETYKQFLLQNYGEYISMLGKSIGGAGIFFLVRTTGLTKQNFKAAYEYFRTNLFQELPIDNKAKGIARNFFIPFDEKLYTNKNINVDISELIIDEDIKCTGRCIYRTHDDVLHRPVHFADVTFLSMNEVLGILNFQTPVDMEGHELIVKPVDFIKLYVPEKIADGAKHKTFHTIVNVLVHLNPAVELLPILSYMNWVNQSRTCGKPMITKEMIRTVSWAYDFSKQHGIFNPDWVKTKRIHFSKNSGKTKDERKQIGKERSKIANTIIGEIKAENSKLAIKIVVDELKEQGIKPTINEVSKTLTSRLGITTIKKYWRSIVPKIAALPDEKITESTNQLTMQQNPYKLNRKMPQVHPEPLIETKPDEELKKPLERQLSAEEIAAGFQPLEYFIKTWERHLGLQVVYEMYELQFDKMPAVMKKPNLLKAV